MVFLFLANIKTDGEMDMATLNENDQKIRKQWLIVWIISTAINFISTVLRLLYEGSLNPFPIIQYGFAALSFLILGALSYAAYRCIYKKPGTKLLTFFLILAIIGLVMTPILYLSGKLQPPAYVPYYKSQLFVSQLMGLVWVVVCWRMRQTNKRLQALKT